jgi:hypothetical protein
VVSIKEFGFPGMATGEVTAISISHLASSRLELCKKCHTSGTCRTLMHPGSTASFPDWQRCSGRISGREKKDSQELELANI